MIDRLRAVAHTKDALDGINAKIDDTQKRLDALCERFESSLSHVDALNERMAAVRKEQKEFADTVSRYKRELDSVVAEVGRVKSKAEHEIRGLESLKENVSKDLSAALSREVASATESLKGDMASFGEAKEKVQKAASDIDALLASFATFKDMTAQIKGVDAELVKSKGMLEELLKENHALKQENAKMARIISERRRERGPPTRY